MTDPIEFDPVDAIGAGAFGLPGARTFVIQARKGSAMLSVLVEKEQVQLLANEAEQFLDRIADEHPEEPGTFGELAGSGDVEEDEPLFRATDRNRIRSRTIVGVDRAARASGRRRRPTARGRGERRTRRAALRDPRADPGDARERRCGGHVGPAQVPAV